MCEREREKQINRDKDRQKEREIKRDRTRDRLTSYVSPIGVPSTSLAAELLGLID